jgi:hypothetical protein
VTWDVVELAEERKAYLMREAKRDVENHGG